MAYGPRKKLPDFGGTLDHVTLEWGYSYVKWERAIIRRLITHSHGSVREFVRASQWGNVKIDPLPRQNPPKLAYVITSRISTHTQNLVTIPQGVSFPRMREIAHQRCLLGFFFPGSSNGPQPRPLNRFSRKIRQTTWFRARMCLFGVRKQKFNI